MNPQALEWDIHRKFSRVSLMEMDAEGEIHAVERARLEHADKEGMQAWLSRLDPEIPVALEATFGWPWVADLLEELGHAVHFSQECSGVYGGIEVPMSRRGGVSGFLLTRWNGIVKLEKDGCNLHKSASHPAVHPGGER